MPTAIEKVNIWSQGNGAPIEQRDYPEAASQTFKRGELVYLSSGKVTVAVADDTDVASGTKVLGIALRDASGTTDTAIPVALANPLFRWVLPVSNDGATQTTAVTQVGVAYELHKHTNGKWSCNINGTTDTKVVVTALHPQYAAGEAFGWVEVGFIAAQVDISI